MTITADTPITNDPSDVADPEDSIKLLWLDPRDLIVHPDNLRDDLGDLSGLTASIAEIGVLEPLIVTPCEDGYCVNAGHRRQAAAIAGRRYKVPCITRPDRTAKTDQLVTMLAENIRRRNLRLIEEARGYAQLALAGMSITKIAKATGSKRNHIKQSLTVADSEAATAAASRYDLTLVQAIAIAEFQDWPEAVDLLITTAEAEPGQWDHILGRLHADRDAEAAYTAKADELAAAGVRVIDDNDLPDSAVPLGCLTDDDGQALDPDAHTACPGHAVTINPWDPDDIDAYCLDPDTAGHRERASRLDLTATARPSGMTDEQKAERRQVIENNKAWRAAEKVRRDFLRSLLARRTAPKGTLRFVTETIVTRPDDVGNGTDELVADLLGSNTATTEQPYDYGRQAAPRAAAEATDARLPLVLLAQVAADTEHSMGVHTWRNRDPRAARWLSWLAEVGYNLSDIETSVNTDTEQ